jgi:amino acid transporter
MNLLFQLFTYIFRPLPFEAHSVFSLFASIDNVLILVIFILSLLSIIFLKRQNLNLNHPNENRWFLLIFSSGLLVILSLTTANLGIAVRQKWMVLPMLLYFAFLCMRVRWSDQPKLKKA